MQDQKAEDSYDAAPSPAWSCAAVVEHIADGLEENEAACSLRPINKFTASVLRGRRAVRLSRPSPPHAFAARWGAPDAMRSLSLKQRQLMLQLTAGSGCVANLEIALVVVGCAPTATIFAAAAAGGHLPACEALLRHGCPWGPQVLEAAARASRRDIVAWLLRAGCPPGPRLLEAAAAAGHTELCEWLAAGLGLPWSAGAAAAAARGGFATLAERAVRQLEAAAAADRSQHGGGDGGLDAAARLKVLEGVAEGCDLESLQRLQTTWLDPDVEEDRDADGPADGRQAQPPPLSAPARAAILAAAAGSPTPDWREKLEWLLTRRGYSHARDAYPRARDACARATVAPDAVQRLGWLRRAGFAPFSFDSGLAAAVARSRRVDVLDFLTQLDDAWRDSVARYADCGGGHVEEIAATAGDDAYLAFLRELHARGASIRCGECLECAVRTRRVAAAKWLLENCGGGGEGDGAAATAFAARLTAAMAVAGAASGSLEMVAWLYDRGCPWDARAFAEAAAAGCETQMVWMAEHGCPMGDDGEPYVRAARNGDVATLRCLRALGCPWGQPVSGVFTAAVAWACGLSVLAWLLQEGCPVDWEGAAEAAALRQHPPGIEVWLREQRSARTQ